MGRIQSVGRFYPFSTRRAMDGARRLANYMVSTAIKKGTLVKKKCEVCSEDKSEAHHDDYSKPLDVRWLCRSCHRAWHASNGYNDFSVRPRPRIGKTRKSFLKTVSSAAVIKKVTKSASNVMRVENISQSDISDRIGTSRQMVSVWFGGGFRTIKSLCAFASAVGYDLEIRFVKKTPKARK